MPENLPTRTKGYEESLKVSPQWAPSYGATEFLIKKFNVKIAAEIGVARGHHSAHLLEAIPDLKLYSINPWGFYLKEHLAMYGYHTLADDEKIYQQAAEMLKPFGQRSKIIRSTSARAAPLITEPLDMIFIDADHTYESVKRDIGLWWDKVKVGGIISGHDYGHSHQPGVKKAVDEYFGHKGLNINQAAGSVWWIEKPAETLSYIIPSYNADSFLAETVESIFRQNLKIPFEVIISDDHSADGTQELIKKLAGEHREIIYFLNEKSLGAPANRNFAISQSKGNFIYMLDHDNILEDNSIQKLIDAINKRGCGAATFQELYFFKGEISNHRGSWLYKYPDNLFTIREFINHPNSPAASNNYMFTRAAYDKAGGYPDRGARENLGFGLRLVATSTPIAIVPDTKYYHRIISSGMWHNEHNKNPNLAHLNMAKNFREFIDLFDEKSKKLLLSQKAEAEADFYIKKGKLKLSAAGLKLAGKKEKFRLTFPVPPKLNLNKKIKAIIKRLPGFKKIIFYKNIFLLRPSLSKKIKLFLGFASDFKKYRKINTNKNFFLSKKDWEPRLYDKTETTPLDAVYFYQDAWCAKKIFTAKPPRHYDIGSKAELVGIISQFVPTTMIDIRPIDLKLDNLSFIKADILSLPLKNGSVESISSICVIEHIGLGRYGDDLSPYGSEKAISEIKRVLAAEGNLYISLPVDQENTIYFNAHRAFTRNYILELFQPLKLVEEKYIYRNELVNNYDKAKGFGTGLFHFQK